MLSPGIYNFTIYQGSTFKKVFTWYDSSGVLVDLTNYSVRLKAKINKSDEVAVLDSNDNFTITLGGALGTITWEITNVQTQALNFYIAYYDMEVIDGSDNVDRLLEGEVTLKYEVTD